LIIWVSICVISISLFILYTNTFQGTQIAVWTHGPFNFDCGNYLNFGTGSWSIATEGDKVTKHFLCALLYKPIYTTISPFIDSPHAPSPCSFMASLGILIFGIWLYWRTKNVWLSILIILLLGLSFTTWYAASIWESRSFIIFGSVILLISIDRFIRQPTIFSVFLLILSTSIVLKIIFEPYILAPVTFTIMTRIERIGVQRTFVYIVSYLLSVLTIFVVFSYLISPISPWMHMRKIMEVIDHDTCSCQASISNLNHQNLQKVSLISLVYSVGGLKLPAGARIDGEICEHEWAKNPEVYKRYLDDLSGTCFFVWYGALIVISLLTIVSYGLWYKEPLLSVIVVWIITFIGFTTYYYHWVGPPWAAELMAPLWAGVGIVMSYQKKWITIRFLLIIVLIVAWNNYEVMEFLKQFYS